MWLYIIWSLRRSVVIVSMIRGEIFRVSWLLQTLDQHSLRIFSINLYYHKNLSWWWVHSRAMILTVWSDPMATAVCANRWAPLHPYPLNKGEESRNFSSRPFSFPAISFHTVASLVTTDQTSAAADPWLLSPAILHQQDALLIPILFFSLSRKAATWTTAYSRAQAKSWWLVHLCAPTNRTLSIGAAAAL
jgi:hypothetical protein